MRSWTKGTEKFFITRIVSDLPYQKRMVEVKRYMDRRSALWTERRLKRSPKFIRGWLRRQQDRIGPDGHVRAMSRHNS